MEASEKFKRYFKSQKEPNWGMILMNLVPFVGDVIRLLFENRKANGKIKLIKLVMEIHGPEMDCKDLIDRINKIIEQ